MNVQQDTGSAALRDGTMAVFHLCCQTIGWDYVDTSCQTCPCLFPLVQVLMGVNITVPTSSAGVVLGVGRIAGGVGGHDMDKNNVR